MRRFGLVLVAVAFVSVSCGTTHAAGPPHRHVSRTAGVYIALIETTSVQREVRASTGVTFGADPKRVIGHGDHVRGDGSVLTLGLVPPTGDHIIVGAGAWYGNTGGQARNYGLSGRGGEWHVVGDTGIVGVS